MSKADELQQRLRRVLRRYNDGWTMDEVDRQSIADAAAYLNEKPHEADMPKPPLPAPLMNGTRAALAARDRPASPPPYTSVDVFAGIDRKTTEELRLPPPPHAAAEPDDALGKAMAAIGITQHDQKVFADGFFAGLRASPSAQPIAREPLLALLKQMREEHNFHHYHGCEYDEGPDVACSCFIGALHKQVDDALKSAGKESPK